MSSDRHGNTNDHTTSPEDVAARIAEIRRAKGLPDLPRTAHDDAAEPAAEDAPAVRALQAIRARREFRGRSLAIAGLIADVDRDARSRRRQLGNLAELWLELVPPRLVERTTLAGLRGGTLNVTAESAAVAYEINRLIRSGLLAELRRGFRGALGRVRVTVKGERARRR